MRNQTRYFALKLPIAVDAKTATFAYVDAVRYTDTELRSWGAAHEWLWQALHLKGIEVPRRGNGSRLHSHNPGRGGTKNMEQPCG